VAFMLVHFFCLLEFKFRFEFFLFESFSKKPKPYFPKPLNPYPLTQPPAFQPSWPRSFWRPPRSFQPTCQRASAQLAGPAKPRQPAALPRPVTLTGGARLSSLPPRSSPTRTRARRCRRTESVPLTPPRAWRARQGQAPPETI
jgi:hypothetical protein